MPLPGEDILVSKLANAASWAAEKGLAVEPQLVKKELVIVAAADTASISPAQPPDTTASARASGPGPRSAGARRSAERSGGTRKTATPPEAPPSYGEES
eukprot:CAMPEP_0201987382 /NCGR_PEP_ID=MMETSP0904-20121228/91767_1 /ASSEMBLY_ACC=CAM_ASM_000553 /TAXON_ID=420261 /ORGANISM="Thalassiosira antarctica, Strain CCMP982" /LENGTH=98 /DNA_ID=CAMNT_0048541487 /DNA_START=1541 /DNA_END=1837 /DNA_ORIENTATION=-